MAKRKFWQIPRLHFEEEQNKHRKVTWLELFFDLYFVVVIAALAHNLSADLSMFGFGEFALTFIPVWWIWIGVTFYNERFETDGFENRLFVFLLMIPIAGLAIYSHDALGHNLTGFVLSYALARLIIVILWAYATYHNQIFRKAGRGFILGFSISIVLCVAAAMSSHQVGMILFGLAMIIDLLTPLLNLKQNNELPKFSTSKLPERFGLFMIIVLGEGIVGTINGISKSEHIGSGLIIFGILGIAITFALWWIYFDFIGRRVADNTSLLKQIGWTYLHLPLVISFVAIGSSLTGLSGEIGDSSNTAKMILIMASGSALIFMASIESILKETKDEPMFRIASELLKVLTGIGILSLYFFKESMNSTAIMIGILMFLVINMIYGMYVWFNQELNDEDLAEEEIL